MAAPLFGPPKAREPMPHFGSSNTSGGTAISGAATIAFAMLVSSSMRTIPGLVALSMQRELGWSSEAILAPLTFGLLLSTFGSPFAVVALDRFGLKRVIVVGMSTLTLSMAASAFVNSPWQLMLLWSLGIGVSGSLVGSVLGGSVAARRFPCHCGAGASLFSSIQVIGPALAMPLVALVIEAYGWRGGLIIGGLIGLFSSVMVNLTALENGWPTRHETSQQNLWRRTTTSNRCDLLLLAALFAVCGASTTGVLGNNIGSFCNSNGISLTAGTGALAIMSVSSLVGGLGAGWLAERFSAAWLLVLYYTARGISLLWLPYTTLNFEDLSRFSIFYGFDWAATFPALVVIISRTFGANQVGPVIAWMMVAHQLGAAAATGLIGVAGLQNYDMVLSIVGVMCLAAAAATLLLSDARLRQTPPETLFES